MVGTIIIPILQMEKLRHSEVESLAPDPTDCVSELVFKPKQSDSRAMLLVALNQSLNISGLFHEA